jgi:hypothetical protein
MKPLLFICLLGCLPASAQLRWTPVDSFNSQLPPSVRVYQTTDSLDGAPNIAWYVSARLNDESLVFDTDTTYKRRLTPSQFFQKNEEPLIVVNGTFFSFQTSQNLNTVVRQGKAVSFNIKSVKGPGADSLKQMLIYRSALGIFKNGRADVAWVMPDSARSIPRAAQQPVDPFAAGGTGSKATDKKYKKLLKKQFHKWPVYTAIGGGPVLLQNGEPAISNRQEAMFSGKAINDKHPRTAMGYTADGTLIILVIQGRFKGLAEGACLPQEARILQQLGCVEALNLDGGGSSCLLVNGKQTITPSDATGQRPVPAVFIIKKKG